MGFPNVRHAEVAEEVEALDKRYETTIHQAKSQGCEDRCDEFERWVKDTTRPVVCRGWGIIQPMLSKPKDLFRSFYELLEAGERSPLDNGFDQQRQGVDATFFPYFYQSVNFAALSGNGRGPASYGDCHFTFKEPAISHRRWFLKKTPLSSLGNIVSLRDSVPQPVTCSPGRIAVGSPS
ncbi:MAG: hypothetical protein AAGD07_04580 [Planctomycetota bacterium]